MVMTAKKKPKSPAVVRDARSMQVPDFLVSFTKRIGAGEFKARCLELMNEVRDQGGEYVITKRGEPVAKLVPVQQPKRPKLFGSMKGTVKTLGDIVSPLDEPWEALEGWDDEK
jgi:prevent-host-death family protein